MLADDREDRVSQLGRPLATGRVGKVRLCVERSCTGLGKRPVEIVGTRAARPGRDRDELHPDLCCGKHRTPVARRLDQQRPSCADEGTKKGAESALATGEHDHITGDWWCEARGGNRAEFGSEPGLQLGKARRRRTAHRCVTSRRAVESCTHESFWQKLPVGVSGVKRDDIVRCGAQRRRPLRAPSSKPWTTSPTASPVCRH